MGKGKEMLNYTWVKGEPPKIELNPLKWGEWFETAERTVEKTSISEGEVEMCEVSTVFLGIDHSFGSGTTKPVLFETAIFNSTNSDVIQRYETEKEAITGHAFIVERLISGFNAASIKKSLAEIKALEHEVKLLEEE